MSTSNSKERSKNTRQGAQISDRKPLLGSYFGNHQKSIQHTLAEQKKRPLAAFFTCSVIGIAILLPTLLAILLINIHQAEIDWDSSAQVTVMLEKGVSPIEGSQLAKELAQHNKVDTAVFVDKKTALAEFKDKFDLGETLAHLDENPLPHSIILTLEDTIRTIADAEALRQEFIAHARIELVQLDILWVQRLQAISDFLILSTWILGFMLAIAVLLILGNTIRLAIENRKEEIAVLKLVGGTDAFVCRPFLYLGIFYGFGGGILAVIFSFLVLVLLSQPVEALTFSYQSNFSLSGLNIESTLFILCVGTLLGWLGAWLSVKRHIKEIEPN